MDTTHKNWFNDGIEKIQNIIPFPEKYRVKNIEDNFKNILSDVKYKKTIKLFNLNKPDQNETDELNRTYKYKINFTEQQHIILKNVIIFIIYVLIFINLILKLLIIG